MTRAVADVEAQVRAACDSGDHSTATHILIECYGPELLGFIEALVRDAADADDAFAMFCEDTWRGIAKFEWRCSVRCWSYTLARNAAFRFLRSLENGHLVPLSRSPELDGIVRKVRSTTALHARTEVKSQMRKLREQLALDEQTILILRVDKNLSWEEVARVLAGDDSDEDLGRSTARVRKRFQLVKNKLRRMAEEAGLLTTRNGPTSKAY
jgi:RNA polymerase sigma-70 factor (ECF subfamily)